MMRVLQEHQNLPLPGLAMLRLDPSSTDVTINVIHLARVGFPHLVYSALHHSTAACLQHFRYIINHCLYIRSGLLEHRVVVALFFLLLVNFVPTSEKKLQRWSIITSKINELKAKVVKSKKLIGAFLANYQIGHKCYVVHIQQNF